MHVMIATGGTAGHVVPALAVADVLRARGTDVTFVGSNRIETELVPKAGYRFFQLNVEGLSRSNPLLAARAIVRAVTAVFCAVKLLWREKPDVVIGGGGYVAGPVGVAAVLLRIPLVLTEADRHFGLTNRLLARFACRVCLAFSLAKRGEPRYVVTGRPIPAVWHDRAAARRAFGLSKNDHCILVFGGSLGARSINNVVIEAFKTGSYKVIHIAGVADTKRVKDQVPGEHYQLYEYLEPLSQALAAADLCIARSGGSIFEVAAHGLPAILVPYPHASADHQTANAHWLADAGAAIVISDEKLNAVQLREEVDNLFSGNGERLAKMASVAKELSYPNAANTVADIVEQVIEL